jgi:hypothetical protein
VGGQPVGPPRAPQRRGAARAAGFAASRLRYAADIPKDGRLELACGIPAEYHDKPGIEFVVKVVQDGREHVAWSSS